MGQTVRQTEGEMPVFIRHHVAYRQQRPKNLPHVPTSRHASSPKSVPSSTFILADSQYQSVRIATKLSIIHRNQIPTIDI